MNKWTPFKFGTWVHWAISKSRAQGKRLFLVLAILLFIPLVGFLLAAIWLTLEGITQGDFELASTAGTAAGAIATLFLVGITYSYARQTKQMAEGIKMGHHRENILGLVDEIDSLKETLENQWDNIGSSHPSEDSWFEYPDLGSLVIFSTLQRLC